MSSGDAIVPRLGRPGLLIDGRYRLDAPLGAGGFGEVWKARQEVEGAEVRTVALKLLVPPGSNGADLLATGSTGRSLSTGGSHTWLDEVRAVREVKCSSIVTIFDVGISREPRVAFIAMELLRGETLGDRLRDGNVHWRKALAIARPVADALAVCHAAGVAHCDLKPGNVFLGEAGIIHVLDFGVASLGGKKREAAPEPLPDFAPGGATGMVSDEEMPDVGGAAGPAVIVGTPGYIAPELFLGDTPGPSGDVYALGVMLFRTITGKLPHKVPDDVAPRTTSLATDVERWHAALNTATVRGEQHKLADLAPDVPPAVCALIDRMLAVEPRDRPVADLAKAIDEAYLRPWGVPDPPYVGLAAFDQRRAGYIAGRDGDVDAIAAMLATRRAVVLAGPSGCGKSSLAVAGVVPRLDRDLTDGVDGWTLVTVRPSEGPRVLHVVDKQDAAIATLGDEIDASGKHPLGVAVVIDQMEELLRLPDDERDAFAAAIVTLAEGRAAVAVRGHVIAAGAPVRVLATVRDDLFGAIAALPALERLPERNLFTVRGVAASALGELVEGPANAAGFQLEGAAECVAEARRILDQDPGALPLVQFALTRWWEQRDVARKVLPRAVWQAIGGIEGALAEAAEKLWSQLGSSEEKAAMRSLLVALFRPDGTRVRASEAQVAPGELERRVLARLVERRLVTRFEDDAGAAWLEVVHEALGRRWPTLRSWLDETRAERELLADCEDDAASWVRGGKPVDLLWRGARLAAAVGVRGRLGDTARMFVDAAAIAAGRQRWTRRAVGLAVLLLAGAAGVLVFSFLAAREQRERAAGERRKAEEAKVIAEQERESAVSAREAADLARRSAEDNAKEAQVERTAAQEARDEAARERDAAKAKSAENQQLRDEAMRVAEAARAAESRAHSAEEESRQLNAKLAQWIAEAETERRRAESQRVYAETAQRLHEMAASRLADVEEDLGRLETELAQCKRGQ